MKRFISFLLAASLFAVVAFAIRTWERVAELGHSVVAACQTFARRVVDVLAPAAADGRMPAVRIAQAKSFVARIIRRERLHMTEGWRMCPSI